VAGIAKSVRIRDRGIDVELSSGATLMIPLSSLPDVVRKATIAQRRRARIVGFGTAIHWDELRDGIHLAHVLGVPEQEIEAAAGFHFTPSQIIPSASVDMRNLGLQQITPGVGQPTLRSSTGTTMPPPGRLELVS